MNVSLQHAALNGLVWICRNKIIDLLSKREKNEYFQGIEYNDGVTIVHSGMNTEVSKIEKEKMRKKGQRKIGTFPNHS